MIARLFEKVKIKRAIILAFMQSIHGVVYMYL